MSLNDFSAECQMNKFRRGECGVGRGKNAGGSDGVADVTLFPTRFSVEIQSPR